jgi:hypothetical protein
MEHESLLRLFYGGGVPLVPFPMIFTQKVRIGGALHLVGKVGGKDTVKGQSQKSVDHLVQPGMKFTPGQLLLQLVQG